MCHVNVHGKLGGDIEPNSLRGPTLDQKMSLNCSLLVKSVISAVIFHVRPLISIRGE